MSGMMMSPIVHNRTSPRVSESSSSPWPGAWAIVELINPCELYALSSPPHWTTSFQLMSSNEGQDALPFWHYSRWELIWELKTLEGELFRDMLLQLDQTNQARVLLKSWNGVFSKQWWLFFRPSHIWKIVVSSFFLSQCSFSSSIGMNAVKTNRWWRPQMHIHTRK